MCCPEDLHEPRLELETDPRFDQIMAPWDGAEAEYTMREDNFHRWNALAYPLEVVTGLGLWVQKLQRGRHDGIVVIETGTGQGYTTRRLGPLMRPEFDLYWAYESDPDLRTQIAIRDFWLDNLSCCIKEYPTPEAHEFGAADLVMIDSDYPWAYAEFYLWEAARRSDSILVTSLEPSDVTPRDHDLARVYLNPPHPDYTGPIAYGEPDTIHAFTELWSNMFERAHSWV